MAVFLPIVPNWQNGVRDTYEFKTDVFTSRDGSEQRRSERVQPRRTIEAAILLDGDRLRTFADALHLARDGKVLVSDFSADSATLVETVSDGATVLKLDRVPTWLHGSMDCALLTGRKARKITVDFVSGNQVVLTAGVVGAVGQGATLLPLVPASLQNTNTLSIYTTAIATSAIKLDVEPGTVVRVADALPFDGGPQGETTQVFGPAALFYGRYVLLRKPNYVQQPQMAFNIAFETVDYGRGITKTYTPVPLISRTLTATYMGVSHADVMTMLDVFVRARGRAAEIYVPTWAQDFPPIKGMSGSNIRFAGTDFYDAYHADPAHQAILIRTTDGSLIPHEISNWQIDSGDTLIATETPIGATAAQIELISWMFVSRFATDSLTIQWVTNGVANIALSFVTLANLAAEESFGNNWILATGHWRDTGQWQDGSVWED
ncbi:MULTISPECIES: hypothetical protein [unclassified Mesorhizobium]|uniref:hypothetical protein n=1 Tax=unclassified Mesorhizobium TaxID=325217 RepID=UPI001093D8F6|nr:MULTISPECIES: hypothetical protein [unclassified Mesorhizobium]TGT90919.1 hypothetical protein EN804_06175 [Mesorhizobium sp. M8A.F.Ca.ET.161.01.1.1]TGV43801.1 hypothetical protein EN785_07370 [Mesorhizobium sp. M8A.F.Ca.ET.142.01.1.1]